MITYEKSNRMTFVAAAVVLGLVVGGGVWWMQGGKPEDLPGGAGAATSGVSAWFKGSSDASAPSTLSPGVDADGRPVDVDAGDWGALNGALAKAQIDPKHGERIVSFLRFQHAFEDWQNIDETKEAARRARVGEGLLAQVPERMKTGEFTPVEANLMGSVLIAGIETDEQLRAKRMEEWQSKISQIAPMPTDEKVLQDQFKKIEYGRRLAAAYDDWQKLEPNDPARSAGKLESAFADVQRAVNSGEL